MVETHAKSSSPLPRSSVYAVLALALVLRAGVLIARHEGLSRDPDSYREVAENLVEYGVFGHRRPPGIPEQYVRIAQAAPSDASASPASPQYPAGRTAVSASAHRPPLYPLLLAPCVYLGPQTSWGIAALHLALGLLTVVSMRRLASAWGLSPGGTILAMLLVACDPILLYQSSEVMTETLATLVAVWLLIALSVPSSGSTRGAVAAGLCGGAAILCRPTFLPFVLLMALTRAVASPAPSRARWPMLFLGGVAWAMLPWIALTTINLGAPIATTTHGGHTLRLANNGPYYAHLRQHGFGAVWDSKSLPQVIVTNEEAIGAGMPREVLLDRRNYRLALDVIAHDPSGFLLATLDRLGKTWRLVPAQRSPDEGHATQMARYTVGAWYLVEFGLALTGLVALGRGLLTAPWLYGVMLAGTFTLIHAVYWTDMRMRSPLAPVIALAAASGAESLRARYAMRRAICEAPSS